MNKKREFVLFATVSSISFWELRSTTPLEWYSRYSIEWSSSNIVALFFGGFLVPNGGTNKRLCCIHCWLFIFINGFGWKCGTYKGSSINHVGIEGEGVSQMVIILHKHLVKWSKQRVEGVKNVQKLSTWYIDEYWILIDSGYFINTTVLTATEVRVYIRILNMNSLY